MKAGEQVSIRVFPFEFMDDKEEHVVRFDEVSDSFKYQAFFEYWRFEG